MLPPDARILTLKCIKIDFGWGPAPDPAGGAYSAPPHPQLDLRGLLLGGGEGGEMRGGKGRVGEGKGGEGRSPKAGSFPKNWGCIEYSLITIFSKQKQKIG